MADHPDITPDELTRAAEVFQATASYTKAAAAIGRSISATWRALRSAANGETRARVYARTLDAVLAEGVTAQRTAVKVLRADLKAPDPKVAHSAAAMLNDTMRAASTARTALAKLTGEHAPDKVDASITARVVMLPTLEDVRPEATGSPVGSEPRSSD